MIPQSYVKLLDHGYVGLVDHMGNDATIVNSARVSFNKQIEGELTERDIKLIRFLIERNERSVLRQATLQFEIYMPLMVARQYWKYIVGTAHIDDGVCMNESSRRYVTEEVVFYQPRADKWRAAPDNKKQGSGVPLDARIGEYLTNKLIELDEQGYNLYQHAIEALNVAPEQARLFLPAYGLYVRIRTTMSLANFIHFLEERLGHTAQKEIYEYAVAMRDLTRPLFPYTFAALGL